MGHEDETTMHVAEVPFESGGVRFRYSRCKSADGSRWIRHGLFQAFHPNGQISTEGLYERGLEQGVWRDYHMNGRPAAEGPYKDGKKHGLWRYWNELGEAEVTEEYFEGAEVSGSD